jgi:hypothetical protein
LRDGDGVVGQVGNPKFSHQELPGLKNVYEKMRVHSRAEAVAKYMSLHND